jgi:hypothetical protein
MKMNKVSVWLPSPILLGSIVGLGILWILGMLPQLYEFRRSLMDGFAIFSAVIVIIASLGISILKRSFIALCPSVVIAGIVLA